MLNYVFVLLLPVIAHAFPDIEGAQYISNHDGDTIKVEIPGVNPLLGHSIAVRVRGVDTPEMDSTSKCTKALAVKAQQVIAARLRYAKKITLKNPGRDKYFRILADIEVDGVKVSKILLDQKLARVYNGGTKSTKPWCKD